MFVNGYFLSVKRWHQKFVVSEAKETYSAIWVRVLELPTEFYDLSILAGVGKKMRRLVKIDICTSSTLRCCYARICMEVPIGIIVKKHITISHHLQTLVNEDQSIHCTTCGFLGHIDVGCTNRRTTTRIVQPKASTQQIAENTSHGK